MKSRISIWITAAACGAFLSGNALACSVSPQTSFNVASLGSTESALASTLVSPRIERETPAEEGSNQSIVGLWNVTFFDQNNQVVDKAYEIFHADGTELMVDTSAPATDNVCVGVWKQPARNTIKLKHVSFVFDLAGNLLGTATFHTTITLDVKGNSFQGTTTVDIFDTLGHPVFSSTGPVKGTRITAD